MGSLNGRKIEAMYRKYGPGPEGKTCADCDNCFRVTPTERHYNKCRLYGDTSGDSTDWRLKWPACGMFNRESGEIPVIEQLKHTPRTVIRREECAVSILSDCWLYGEQLRVWHNAQYGHSGDGVVNPAILSIRR